MKRIGITQRVEGVVSYSETRDCLDQRWISLCTSLNLLPIPIPNNLAKPIDWCKELDLDGFILSGGNDLSNLSPVKNISLERDNTERLLLDLAQDRAMPVLGVCRGMMMINTYFGGQLIQVAGHVASRHPINCLTHNPLFLEYKEVNSYHNWGLYKEHVALPLQAQVQCSLDNTIEAINHCNLPIVGIMWHPERESSLSVFDRNLILSLFGEQ